MSLGNYVSSAIDLIKRPIKKGRRIGLVGLVSGLGLVASLDNQAYASPAVMSQMANAAFAVPANSGVDTDRDGLSDNLETSLGYDPNVASSTNAYEFFDNMDLRTFSDPPFGFSAINIDQIIQTDSNEVNRHHWPVSFSKDNKTLWYVSTGDDGGNPVAFTDPILWSVSRGNPASATAQTTSGELGSIYLFNGGCALSDNSGIAYYVNTSGIVGGGGKVVKITNAGDVSDYFVPSTGFVFDPYIHDFGGTTGEVLFVPKTLNGLNTTINSYNILRGGPDESTENIIANVSGAYLRWPVVKPDGTNMGITEIVSPTQWIAGTFNPFGTSPLEDKVTTPGDFYTGNFGEDNGNGAFFSGFLRDNFVTAQDFSENVFNHDDVDFTNTDFDIRVTHLQGNGIIKYVNDQFLPKLSSDAIVAFSSDPDGDGFMNLYLASLRTRVVWESTGGFIPTDVDLIYYTPAGEETKIERGTTVNTPNGERTLTVAPEFDLADINLIDSGTISPDRVIADGPAGTTFVGAKSGATPFTRKVFVDDPINAQIYDVAFNESTSLWEDVGGLLPITEVGSNYVIYGRTHFSNSAVVESSSSNIPGGDSLPATNNVGLAALIMGLGVGGAVASGLGRRRKDSTQN